jgi:hypothetical protein
MVLAHRDPGYHNWIDTCGFERGQLCNRNMLSDRWTEFRTRLVKHEALSEAMPAQAARVTPEQRTAQMLRRFHAITRRYWF